METQNRRREGLGEEVFSRPWEQLWCSLTYLPGQSMDATKVHTGLGQDSVDANVC